MKYLFLNHNTFTIQLPDNNGRMVVFAKHQKIILDEYFKRYVPKHLSIVRVADNSKQNLQQPRRIEVNKVRNVVLNNKIITNKAKVIVQSKNRPVAFSQNRRIVGKVGHSGVRATEFSVAKIKNDIISISNNIGVGILSYNRLQSLAGLITSIRKYTDLTRTTIFVSDESTDPKVWEWLKDQKDIIAFTNPRIGIAGNTNRLLRCLDRFKYKLLLNDDVEILANGWDIFYFNKMVDTNIKHFCYRQTGVYNATRPVANKSGIITVQDKPHGAVLAIHDDAFRKVGFMDESFGIYGYEHVDYSDRIMRAGFTPNGYHDVLNSDQYFKIYNDKTSDEQKSEHYQKARTLYSDVKNDKSRIYIGTSEKSALPSVSYVIPFRDIGRSGCIETVIQNVRAQRFPIIQIVLVEQDDNNINKDRHLCIDYVFSKNKKQGLPFCKSQAFNDGVEIAKNNNIILHDADMLVRGDYTTIMNDLLNKNESVHIGATVCYMTKESTDKIITEYKINENNVSSDRIVNYYEGGSLGIRKDVYIRIGGFSEEFVGYGCFSRGNFVLTNNGMVDIANINVGDSVMTHTGKYQKVTKKFSRNYNGTVFNIFVPGKLPIKGVTLEHPFKIENKWIMAKDLKIGMNITEQKNILDMVIEQNLLDIISNDKSKNKIDKKDLYSDDMAFIIGLFLAEGVVKLNKAVYFYIHKNEKELLNKIVKSIINILPNASIKYHYIKNNCREIRIFNSQLAKIVNAISPKARARTKVIAKWYIDKLSISSKLSIINGLIDGDGNKQNGSQNRFVYTTGSINLANTVSTIMSLLDIKHSFGKRITGGFKINEYYDITINKSSEHLLNIATGCKQSFNKKEVSRHNHIYKITPVIFDGTVYNMEVENDNSYIVNGIVVHNCEDCDFFWKIKNATKLFNERSINLMHLFHNRNDNWQSYHDKNKLIESSRVSQGINKSIADDVKANEKRNFSCKI